MLSIVDVILKRNMNRIKHKNADIMAVMTAVSSLF